MDGLAGGRTITAEAAATCVDPVQGATGHHNNWFLLIVVGGLVVDGGLVVEPAATAEGRGGVEADAQEAEESE